MTLNANYPGARLGSGRAPLEGSDRGLDALVGLVILVAEVLIGFLAISSLYLFGSSTRRIPTRSRGCRWASSSRSSEAPGLLR